MGVYCIDQRDQIHSCRDQDLSMWDPLMAKRLPSTYTVPRYPSIDLLVPKWSGWVVINGIEMKWSCDCWLLMLIVDVDCWLFQSWLLMVSYCTARSSCTVRNSTVQHLSGAGVCQKKWIPDLFTVQYSGCIIYYTESSGRNTMRNLGKHQEVDNT